MALLAFPSLVCGDASVQSREQLLLSQMLQQKQSHQQPLVTDCFMREANVACRNGLSRIACSVSRLSHASVRLCRDHSCCSPAHPVRHASFLCDCDCHSTVIKALLSCSLCLDSLQLVSNLWQRDAFAAGPSRLSHSCGSSHRSFLSVSLPELP